MSLSLSLPWQAKLIENSIQQVSKVGNAGGLLPIILGSCLVAPIVEECLYRFFIFKVLGKNNPFTYLLSYLAFILSHWQFKGDNIISLFTQYSVAAVGFIWIYKKNNWNLIYPIILHALVNVVFIGIILINPNCVLV